MTVGMIAAVSRNGVIGDGARMPWHLPEDLAHFKRTTMGHTLLMGRRTFDSIGRALPGRRTVVLTRNPAWAHADVEVAHTFAEGLALAGPTELWVAGGGEVYRLAMPYAVRLVITEVDQDVEGSVTFPVIDPRTWTETSRASHDGFAFVGYSRSG
jgi:dihydrofolate reductase